MTFAMVLRAALIFCSLCALFFPAAGASAQEKVIWVALSAEGGVYRQTATVLEQQLPGVRLQVRHWRDWVAQRSEAPDLMVAVGAEAMQRMADSMAAWPGVPLVALLVPRASVESVLRSNPSLRLTGVYLDQPFERQFQLIKRALPGRARVGVVLGPSSARYLSDLQRAAKSEGLILQIQTAMRKEEVAPALQAAMTDADVFLAVPDSVVFSSHMAQYVLIASYRAGLPLVGYSASLAKAGALASLHATPEQVGLQGAELIRRVLSKRGSVPPLQGPAGCEITVNENVSRVLGLPMDGPGLERTLCDQGGRP